MRDEEDAQGGDQGFWIFGYGSLMWRPGIVHMAKARARVHGYHRDLCVRSRHYRGTLENPGLVMGLDRGGSCNGIAFLVAPDQAPSALRYLDEREMIYSVYRRVEVALTLLDDGARRVIGTAYVVDRLDPLYAGALDDTERVAVVRHAVGSAGSNLDYLAKTVGHLAEIGLGDRRLERMLAMATTGHHQRRGR